MKIVKPKTRKILQEIYLDKRLVLEDLTDILVTNQEVDFQIQGIEMNGCKFVGVDFSLYPFKEVTLIDCIFEKCNLLGCDFTSRGIHRVCFDRCNLVGCSFVFSSLNDISILESKCNYINFSDSKIKHLLVSHSIMKEGRFVSTSFDDCYFKESDFESCEFLNTKLNGLDFSTCNIANIGVSAKDIRGVVVNEEQALMLISLFGIMVK